MLYSHYDTSRDMSGDAPWVQVETLERAMQEHSGRLAGEEAGRLERQQRLSEGCEAAEAAAQRAERMATEAAERARQVGLLVIETL